jgi:hypothetical protein
MDVIRFTGWVTSLLGECYRKHLRVVGIQQRLVSVMCAVVDTTLPRATRVDMVWNDPRIGNAQAEEGWFFYP